MFSAHVPGEGELDSLVLLQLRVPGPVPLPLHPWPQAQLLPTEAVFLWSLAGLPRDEL